MISLFISKLLRTVFPQVVGWSISLKKFENKTDVIRLMKSTYVMYSKKVDKGSVAWHSMCLYSSTNLRVHFSTIVVVCNGEGSARKL